MACSPHAVIPSDERSEESKDLRLLLTISAPQQRQNSCFPIGDENEAAGAADAAAVEAHAAVNRHRQRYAEVAMTKHSESDRPEIEHGAVGQNAIETPFLYM